MLKAKHVSKLSQDQFPAPKVSHDSFVHIPRKYVQGADAIAELALANCQPGKDALLIADIIGAKKLLPRIRDSF